MKRTVTMPAGTYYLGDPCYSFETSDSWSRVLDSCDTFSEPVATIDGEQVLGFSTAYGDGVYRSSDGGTFPVDAGLIGLVPVAVAKRYAKSENDGTPFGVQEYTFSEPFECTNDNGVMKFGHVEIDTLNEEDEDEEAYV